LFPTIERFLIENGLKKAAKAFRKEAGIGVEGRSSAPLLMDIFAIYRAHQQEGERTSVVREHKQATAQPLVATSDNKKKRKRDEDKQPQPQQQAGVSAAPEEPSPASDKRKPKKRKTKKHPAPDAADDEPETAAAPVQKKKKKTKKAKQDKDDHAKKEEEDKEKAAQAKEEQKKREKETPQTEETPKNKKKKAKKTKKTKANKATDKDEEQTPNGEANNVEAEQTEAEHTDSPQQNGKAANGNGAPTAKPFKRVDDSQILPQLNAELRDNSYAALRRRGDNWGDRANQILGAVRGKGFRHEKTKKKRGTYRGGTIDPTRVNSIRFD